MVGELQPGVHVPTVNSTGKTDTSHLYIFLRIGETHAKKERERERENLDLIAHPTEKVTLNGL